MSDELIIVNHVGTSVIDAINNELNPLVDEIKAYTGKETILAFNSERAIKKLKNKDIHIEHINNLLTNRHIKILPTHLVGGNDFNILSDFIKNHCKNIQSNIKLLEPLLSSRKSSIELAKVISQLTKNYEGQIVFIGHGTSDDSNKYYYKFLEIYKEYNSNIKFMTLNDDINISSKKVFLFPLFSVNGHHLRKDIYEGENSIYNRLIMSGKDVKVLKNGLLGKKEIREIYLKQL